MKFIKQIITFGSLSLLVSCSSIATKNAEKAYQYWSGNKPPKEIELIKGEYYQSPHFSLEYELFLKFRSDKKWFSEFVEQNKLEIDTIKNDWKRLTELPEWFQPDKRYLIYAKDQSDQFQRSRYFINPENGMCYIFETVGM